MRRGDIVMVDLEPVRGTEANKRRPAVIVSNDGANHRATTLGRGTITVVPVTSNVSSVLPFQVMLASTDSGLSRDSKAQAEQVRSIDVERARRTVGRVSHGQMLDLDDALRLHLGL